MVAYRFCRPDDAPRLVAAVNDCFIPHFDHLKRLSLPDFQAEVRELDLWPSNCMIAADKGAALAVVIAAKRASEVLIMRVGVRPGFQRQGHGSHLLTSLSQKLAVLGPPRMIAELPAADRGLRRFFESVDYRPENQLVTFQLSEELEPLPASKLLIPVKVDDLLAAGVLTEEDSHICWERQARTLVERSDQVQGLAIATPDRVEAFLLFSGSTVVRLWAAEQSQAGALFPLLLRSAFGGQDQTVRFCRVAQSEVRYAVLQALGFEESVRFVRYAAVAKEA